MALYKAYGELSVGGVSRAPFLLDLLGTTSVAAPNHTEADIDVALNLHSPTDPGATQTGSALGVAAWISPRTGFTLAHLDLRIVILPSADLTDLTTGTTPDPGLVNFVVLEFRTATETPAALIATLGQITSAVYPNDPGPPVDKRVDDEYVVEAVVPGANMPVHIVGGLVTGPMIIFPGKQISTSGPYEEKDASIRGIDLTRVDPGPPPTATSPVSATWFDVTATPNGASTQTHLKVIVGMPHAAGAPSTPAAAIASAAPGALVPGAYEYRVTYAHANGNETSVGPASNVVNLTSTGAIDLHSIPTGSPPPAANPEYAVVARRIYRQGPVAAASSPDGTDNLLVGQLPGPAAQNPPHPLPTTFTDAGNGIDIGGGNTIAPGYYRAQSRLRVRYSADSPLDLGGQVLLVSSGSGMAGIDTYNATVTAAPTSVQVINDDRAALRGDLHAAAVDHPRLTWTGETPTQQLTVQLPGIGISGVGEGVDVRIDGAPEAFGFEWRLMGFLLTDIDVRASTVAGSIDGTGDGGIALGDFGLVAVRIGTGHPAAVWPAAEATVGGELVDRDADPYGAIAARGLRWAEFIQGDGFPPPNEPDRVRVQLLLGTDPANPPAGDRTLRFRRVVDHAPEQQSNPNLEWWGRAGVLPDRLAVDIRPFSTGIPELGNSIHVTVAGEVERIVARLLDSTGASTGGDIGSRNWITLDATGAPVDHDDDWGPENYSLSVDHNDQDTRVQSTASLHATAALLGLGMGSRSGDVHGDLRVPTDVRFHHTSDQPNQIEGQGSGGSTTVTASPDGTWGRVGVVFNGLPLATRSSPQVRFRMRPGVGITEPFDGATLRFLGLLSGELDIAPSILSAPGAFADPVSKLFPTLGLANGASRPNRSFRVEGVEIDGRVQSDPRSVWRGRIAELPDSITAEVDSNDEPGGGVFFLKGLLSSAITGGVVWGEPAQFRSSPTDPRGQFAGLGNVSVLVDTLPTFFEYVDFSGIPFSKLGLPEYAATEQTPSTHAPSGNVKLGGFRLKRTGEVQVPYVRVATFSGDAPMCLNAETSEAGQVARWSEVLATGTVINGNFEGGVHLRPDPNASDGDQTLWVWLYDAPPGTPPSGPPPNPCTGGGSAGKAANSCKAFRVGSGTLVDLAVRQYKLIDRPDRTSVNWDQVQPGTFPVVVMIPPAQAGEPPTLITIDFPFGTWDFDTDLQMKDYRGEITIDPAASSDNPFGDWQAGPGNWYLRAHDQLKDIPPFGVYTGDLYMGNTGNGYHVPFTNGIFSTLAAIYNITWP